MYPPKDYQETDFSKIEACIQQYPLATLISMSEGESYITHLPLMYKKEADGKGKLLGHIDRNNPHAEFFKGENVKVIFHGPTAYISPQIMTTPQLPTWNYIKVHIEGKTKEITKTDDLKNLMVEMTSYLETSEEPFVLDVNDERLEKYLPYILIFEIEIESWEGKFKLSQNKIAADRLKTKEEMLCRNTDKENLETFLDQMYDA